MNPTDAPAFYDRFLGQLRANYSADKVKVSGSIACNAVQDGKFGAMMQVSIENDGPVTITLDSRQKD